MATARFKYLTGALEKAESEYKSRGPLLLLFLAWLATMLVLVAFMIGAMDSYRRFQKTALRTSELQEARGRIIYLDEVLTMSTRMAASTGDSVWEERYRRFAPQLDAVIQAAQQLVPDAQSTGLTDAANAALIEMEGQAFELVREGKTAEAVDILTSPKYTAAKEGYAKGMESLGNQLAEAMDEAMQDQRKRTISLLIAGAIALISLALAWVLVLWMISRWRTVLAGKHRQLVDELVRRKVVEEELRRHRDQLGAIVEERTAELRRANETMRRDLEAGAEYVRGLLAAPIHDRIYVDWRYLPASELGGDTIGHHWIDDDHLALFLIDVSGHGLDSALLSVTVMNVIRSGSLRNADPRRPDEVLAALNDAFQGAMHGWKFFTIWYGVYSVPSRTIHWSGGGHHPALLYQPGHAKFAPLSSAGMMMGVVPQQTFPVESCLVDPGAQLFVFSDGVFEIIRNGELIWSFEELTLYLSELVDSRSEVLDRLLAHVQELHRSTELDDDFTIIEAKFP